jgi:hypothetical protein
MFEANLFYFQELEMLWGGVNRFHCPLGNATGVKNKHLHDLLYVTVLDLKTALRSLLRGVPKSVLLKLL